MCSNYMPVLLPLFSTHGCFCTSVQRTLQLYHTTDISVYICVDVHWCACLHWFVLFYVCLVNIVTGPDKQVMYSILIRGGLLSSLWLGLAHQTVRESESDTNYAETLGICFLNLTYQGVAFSPMHHL